MVQRPSQFDAGGSDSRFDPGPTAFSITVSPHPGTLTISVQVDTAAQVDTSGTAPRPNAEVPLGFDTAPLGEIAAGLATTSLTTDVSVIEGSGERRGVVTVTGYSEPDVFARASSWVEENNDGIIVRDISLHRNHGADGTVRTFELRIYIVFL